eukprot:6194656-Pleurochrysis_carterae.AAC.2
MAAPARAVLQGSSAAPASPTACRGPPVLLHRTGVAATADVAAAQRSKYDYTYANEEQVPKQATKNSNGIYHMLVRQANR